ncbi:glucose-6-phosphate dehydrogenase assembly protein OpcA [Spelaeicoccus albus]|uniref:Glucose-6-phosphate dehydrogenase assembly protein OpcA n=1 Tax=Spelaeicoccus albus TaxID=1280376 RepID=A0A7Z0D459_9MICO|nr:glucose-6-phosphate dehydrogenase assembly protein OpcA [Spelaeicoccus albus]NYI68531.1 glucose-6-phosphate dehydrogenase assembly protein OpcA [Spelaeicoccus albus]
MIVDLPSTTMVDVSKALVRMRDAGGAVTLGRVLTLVIATGEKNVEEAIAASNEASREHPCRVIVMCAGNRRGSARIDAQIRVGGDAGASEVIVLRGYGPLASPAVHDSLVTPLLLPDAPVVVWWPGKAPAVPAESPLGRIAQRRITDSASADNPGSMLDRLGKAYTDGDTDLAWTRLTPWRAQLAAAMDLRPGMPVTGVSVRGHANSPSTILLGAWLGFALHAPVQRDEVETPGGTRISGVTITADDAEITLDRITATEAVLTDPSQPDREISLPRRRLEDCLAEELRRLDADDVYGEVLRTCSTVKKRVKKSGKAQA